MGIGKLGKAFAKSPKAVDLDVSERMFNIPTSIADLPASGVDFSVGGTVPTGRLKSRGNGKTGFKAGKREGERLTRSSRKGSALRKLRN